MQLRIGDIIEVTTPRGLAYLQYCYEEPMFGSLVRVLHGTYRERPSDLDQLAARPERFVAFFPLRAELKDEAMKVVGKAALPEHSKALPLFKVEGHREPETGEVQSWFLWDGQKTWHVDKLTDEQRKLPNREIVNDTLLIERIAGDWSPEAVGRSRRQSGEPGKPSEGGTGIRHFFYVSSSDEANGLASALRDDGLRVAVEQVEAGEWAVIADGASPGEGEIETVRRRYEELASQHGGEYDGWETAT